MTNTVPLTTIFSTFEKIINGYLAKTDLSNQTINFETFIPEKLKHLKQDLSSKVVISPIVTHAIDEIIGSWKSIHLLNFEEPANMHFRKIVECTTVLNFLMEKQKKWEKYNKKWQLFPEAERFARWSNSDRQSWNKETEKIFALHENPYKEKFNDFRIFFDKKDINLTGVLEKDLITFREIDSWISPMRFSNLLENSNSQALAQFYDWWSHSIHFSPLNVNFQKATTHYGNYTEVGLYYVTIELAALFRKLALITTKFENYYYVSHFLTYLAMLNDAKKNPHGFVEKFESLGIYGIALLAIASNALTVEDYIASVCSNIDQLKERNKTILNS